MGTLSRRGLLVGLGSSLASSALTTPAAATVMRGVALSVLTQSSRGVAVVTALGSASHFEELGRRKRIVTDTRVRIDEALAKAEGFDSELLVRTLGGSVGRLGERVHGQVQWSMGEPCVAFLLQGPEGIYYVNGMAQGHYPLLQKIDRQLACSPDLPELIGFESSAVRQLTGTPLSRARVLIRASLPQ